MKNYFISSILTGSAKDIYLAALFSWLLNSGADICFLQETYRVLKKSEISGENSGKETCSFRKVAATVEVYLYW